MLLINQKNILIAKFNKFSLHRSLLYIVMYKISKWESSTFIWNHKATERKIVITKILQNKGEVMVENDEIEHYGIITEHNDYYF